MTETQVCVLLNRGDFSKDVALLSDNEKTPKNTPFVYASNLKIWKGQRRKQPRA